MLLYYNTGDENLKNASVLMTEGGVYSRIVRFAIPIFWGNLFQQLYNVVDSLVLGNFGGANALAAISATSSLIFLMVGFFDGMFMGVGVVISRYFGAGDEENVGKAIQSAVVFGIMAGLTLTVLGLLFTPFLLQLMGTPPEAMEGAVTYVRIYFGGILTLSLFNTANGIFSAVGDSRHPLYYLVISSVLNVVLDLILVIVFDMGIGGTAIATVISQGVSAMLAFIKLTTVKDVHRVHFKNMHADVSIIKEFLHLGVPSGIQNSVISIANVFVQANINSFGAAAVAGCGAHSKIGGFVFIPITSFSVSMTTFIGQNLGAKQYDRAKKGSRFAIVVSALLAEGIGVFYFIFAPQIISLFGNDPQVIAFGVAQARVCALFYFLLAFSHSVAGILRGAGKSTVPMVVMLMCWCVIRVTYITIVTHFFKNIEFVFWAYPLTWFLSSALFLIYYIKSDWIHGFDNYNPNK
ncbi:MAG: MATE family efflux transporter [Oscillospiraceae bacterium]